MENEDDDSQTQGCQILDKKDKRKSQGTKIILKAKLLIVLTALDR